MTEETREWKPADTFRVQTSKKNEDYMMMTYEARSFDTDKLEAPPGHVITGVKFRNIGGHVNLEVQVRKVMKIQKEHQPSPEYCYRSRPSRSPTAS